MKRCFDVAITLLTLPFWGALLLLVACAARRFQGRGVFFTQERAGLRGRPFRLFKFRTMRPGSEPDAERLTRFGRFLRATSLDELPQLINVLKGEMSLVGPRPLPTRYLPRYTPEQNRRHDVRPGITGLAQINGRNALSWEEKFAWDVRYVETHSFGGDLKILFLTFFRVFARSGISAGDCATAREFNP